MKLRTGFVSNSSSSSFVVLLPENFVETIDFDELRNQSDEDFPEEDFTEMIEHLITHQEMWMEDIYAYDKRDYEFQDILGYLIKPYVIATLDSGPDAGMIVLADREKIKNII